MKAHRFSYTPSPVFPGGMPFVTIEISHGEKNISVPALVDSGSAVNVLPFDLGLGLGLDWEQQNFPLDLGGALQDTQAFAVLVQVELAPFSQLPLAFAWVNRPHQEVRVLLGQVNFFQEFAVSFDGRQQVFEIAPHPPA